MFRFSNLILMCFMTFAGCAKSMSLDQTMGLYNGSGVDFRDVSAPPLHVGGYLVAKATKLESPAPNPLPEEMLVSWTTTDGTHHQQRLAVRQKVPLDFRGTIYFRFTPQQKVVLEAVREQDERPTWSNLLQWEMPNGPLKWEKEQP